MGVDWRLGVITCFVVAAIVSFPFLEPDPRATVILSAVVILAVLETLFALRTPARPLHVSRPWYTLLATAALVGSIVHAAAGGFGLFTVTTTTVLTAVVLLAVGSLLRVAALLALGPWYVPAVVILTGQRLVREGPYRFSRHPSYVGLWLNFVATAALTGSVPGLVLTAAAITAFVTRRVREEEAALALAFGAEWRTYASRTRKYLGVAARTP